MQVGKACKCQGFSAFTMSPLVMLLARTEGGGQMSIKNSSQHPVLDHPSINLTKSYIYSYTHCISPILQRLQPQKEEPT